MSSWRPISRPLPECLHGPAGFLGWTVLIGTICGAGVAFFYFLLAMRFDLDEVARLPAGATFLDRRGIELPNPSGSGRKLAKREDLPDFLIKALQAREDVRFFNHSGVDFRGLARATVRNIKDRDFTQGASTLSMQLARNTFDIRAKSIHRKLLEIAITLRIENHYEKDEILTHYLNRIYFGSGSHGIEQAARTYFDKATGDLNDGECAMIVGIIRGPHIYSPLRNFEAALEQRDQTLDRMVTNGFITRERKAEILATSIELATEKPRANQRSYAMEAARREYERILDELDIRLGGLQVKTTLDSAWQSRLETELTRAVTALEREQHWTHPTHASHSPGEEPAYLQYAAVTLETSSGATLALIGGRDFAHSRYDRAHALRDLGSAFEPFIAAAAAERGRLVLPGRPIQTGRQIGPSEVARIAKRCGIGGPFLTTEDLFRGSVSATPQQMAVGLATLGNQGNRPKPYLIQEIRDADDQLLYSASPQLTAAISANAAEEAASVLENHAGTRCFTGATGSERDAWTLRLGPSGSTAIWIGFDRPTPIARSPRLKKLLDEFVNRLGN
jgi:membrane peptidoglycan carboxypeptidase